jgi:hypothetical protein
MREIKKTFLDYKKTLFYFMNHMGCGKTLAKKMSEKIDFFQGIFFTFLPSNAKLDKLYEFSYGGIIPSVPYGNQVYEMEGYPNGFIPEQVTTMDNNLSEFISNYVKKNAENCAIVENVILELSDIHANIKGVKMIPYEKEVYFYLDEKNSIDQIYKTIRRSSQSWHFFSILTELENKKMQSMNAYDLDRICDNSKFIIVGAYDGEGYIFWEKTPTY